MSAAHPTSSAFSLSHQFLIATPDIGEGVFERALIYICQHNEDGALGLVVNKPADMDLPELFAHIELPLGREDLQARRVLVGGPVHPERGFVLHERMRPLNVEPPSVNAAQAEREGHVGWDSVYASSLPVPGSDLEVTTSGDIMQALAQGGGPQKVLLALGLSSWGGGQLEEELAANTWLTLASSKAEALLFELPPELRYDAALKELGLEEWMLGAGAGRA